MDKARVLGIVVFVMTILISSILWAGKYEVDDGVPIDIEESHRQIDKLLMKTDQVMVRIVDRSNGRLDPKNDVWFVGTLTKNAPAGMVGSIINLKRLGRTVINNEKAPDDECKLVHEVFWYKNHKFFIPNGYYCIRLKVAGIMIDEIKYRSYGEGDRFVVIDLNNINSRFKKLLLF